MRSVRRLLSTSASLVEAVTLGVASETITYTSMPDTPMEMKSTMNQPLT